jgi:hypothetical protein
MIATLLTTLCRKAQSLLPPVRFSRQFSRQSVATECRERQVTTSGYPAKHFGRILNSLEIYCRKRSFPGGKSSGQKTSAALSILKRTFRSGTRPQSFCERTEFPREVRSQMTLFSDLTKRPRFRGSGEQV